MQDEKKAAAGISCTRSCASISGSAAAGGQGDRLSTCRWQQPSLSHQNNDGFRRWRVDEHRRPGRRVRTSRQRSMEATETTLCTSGMACFQSWTSVFMGGRQLGAHGKTTRRRGQCGLLSGGIGVRPVHEVEDAANKRPSSSATQEAGSGWQRDRARREGTRLLGWRYARVQRGLGCSNPWPEGKACSFFSKSFFSCYFFSIGFWIHLNLESKLNLNVISNILFNSNKNEKFW